MREEKTLYSYNLDQITHSCCIVFFSSYMVWYFTNYALFPGYPRPFPVSDCSPASFVHWMGKPYQIQRSIKPYRPTSCSRLSLLYPWPCPRVLLTFTPVGQEDYVAALHSLSRTMVEAGASLHISGIKQGLVRH